MGSEMCIRDRDVGEARIEIVRVLRGLVADKHGRVRCSSSPFLLLLHVRPRHVFVDVRAVVEVVEHVTVLDQVLLEVLVRDLVVERLVMLLLFQFLEQLDRLLRGRADRLVLVDSTDVQDGEQLFDVTHDFVLQVCSD